MRRILAFVAGALAVVGMTTSMVGGAAAVGAAPATDEPTVVPIELEFARDVSGMAGSACLPDAPPPPGGATGGYGATVTVHVDGVAVGALVPMVRRLDWFFSATCPGGTRLDFGITNQVLAERSIEPTGSDWASFTVTATAQIDGHSTLYSGTRSTAVSSGPPMGRIDRVESTPRGMRVTGGAALPSTGRTPVLIVAVDGRSIRTGRTINWNNTSEAPWSPSVVSSWPEPDRPTTDPTWRDRGLAMSDFELFLPPGEVCIAVLDQWSTELTHLGCRSVTTDGLARAQIGADVQPVPGTPYSRVALTGVVTDPWADADRPPLIVVSGDNTSESVNLTAAPDLRGPHGDSRGAYRFSHTVDGLSAGSHRLCVNQFGTTAPPWWKDWTGLDSSPWTGRELACTTVTTISHVNRLPIGWLDGITVTGRSITAGGFAVDPDGGAPRVMLTANGMPVAIGRTGSGRPDVQAAHGGDGTAGWTLSVGSMPAGTHDVCALWEDTSTGQWSAGQCQKVVVK